MPPLFPSQTSHTEIVVVNSRFITTIFRVSSPVEVKQCLSQVRAQMPDASHHVYAFRIGHGNSIIEGMSDDGEPSGTAGPPVLAVLRGKADIGDILIVVTRYFGGTKLGTGGLVRAYTEAAQTGLANTTFEPKIAKQMLGVELPYHFYDSLKRMIPKYDGHIEDETFTDNVTVIVQLPSSQAAAFAAELKELSAGRIEPILLDG
jgi:uncharacterized YigZ family protein